MTINPIMARFADELALVNPDKVNRIEALASQLVAHPRAAELLAGDYLATGDYWQDDGGWCRPYVIADGVLQIPIKGVLLHDFPYSFYGYATGYEYIWQAFQRGCADFSIGSIKGIALVSDSPGGQVAGCFDAVDKMVALKAATGVPVWGFAHESAFSAAYAVVGGVADKIAVSRTGGVGSIGVVTMHIDRSGALDQAGLKVTYIASDPSKVEGNPYEPLSADAKQRTQDRINESYEVFVAAVARGRGIDAATIRDDLKAYCFTATQALSNGLADSIGSLEDATAAFAEYLDDPSDNEGEQAVAEPANPVAVDTAALEAAANAAGRTEGAVAERARINAIVNSDEAADRSKLATYLAYETGMPADQAIAMLANSGKDTAAVAAPAVVAPPVAEGSAFDAAMTSTGNPNVGGGEGGEAVAGADPQADILASLSSLGLITAAA